jgi:hypothetical protein
VGEWLTLMVVALSGLVFYRVWVASLRPAPRSSDRSDGYSWDAERPEKWVNGDRVFDVRRAKQLILRTPREVKLVDVASIEKRFEPTLVGVDLAEIGQLPIDLGFPLILVPEGEGVLIIDGWHRVAKAIEQRVATLRAVWLTVAEKDAIVART